MPPGHSFQLLPRSSRTPPSTPNPIPSSGFRRDKLRHKIAELLIGRKEVAFYLVGGELFFEKFSVPIDQSLALLMEQFASRDVGGIVFKPGMTAEEIIRFAGLMNKEAVALDRRDGR